MLLSTPFKSVAVIEKHNSSLGEFVAMIKLVKLPMVCVFIISAFLYVLVEQGIGTWLPTFNNEVLHLPTDISVQVTSIFAGCLAIGRLSAGAILKHVNWYVLLNGCLAGMAVLILLTLPMTENLIITDNVGWHNLPLAAWLFPCIGLFMAPIYPAINSVILSSLPQGRHAAMAGLTALFSALGGTTGSIITGYVFSSFDGPTAFYFTLLPIIVIVLMLKALYVYTQADDTARCYQ